MFSDDESDNPQLHVTLLRQYINALMVNVRPDLLPKELNLIFDSGAVNGLLGIGAALYLHNLEKIKYIKINKISGCSIGSLIAVWYICGCPDTLYSHIKSLLLSYKKNKNFFMFEHVVTEVIHDLFASDLELTSKLNGILYINYYDMKKCKQRVVCKFKDREHLITCILRSSHIPFLTSKCHKYQGRYIDGISPYIFKIEDEDEQKCKNLFIQLIDFTSPLKTLNIKREKNMYSRLIRGVVDTNDFFINDSSAICSYVTYKTKIELFIRQYLVLCFMAFFEFVCFLKNNIPPSLKKNIWYLHFSSLCRISWPCILENIT
jgi:hypothetical protein